MLLFWPWWVVRQCRRPQGSRRRPAPPGSSTSKSSLFFWWARSPTAGSRRAQSSRPSCRRRPSAGSWASRGRDVADLAPVEGCWTWPPRTVRATKDRRRRRPPTTRSLPWRPRRWRRCQATLRSWWCSSRWWASGRRKRPLPTPLPMPMRAPAARTGVIRRFPTWSTACGV